MDFPRLNMSLWSLSGMQDIRWLLEILRIILLRISFLDDSFGGSLGNFISVLTGNAENKKAILHSPGTKKIIEQCIEKGHIVVL